MTGPAILDFRGRAEQRTAGIYADVARIISCEEAALRAVVAVESAGRGFFASGRPVILFERHIFSRRTDGRYDASNPGVSNPKAGGYKGGDREYDRLNEAQRLDADDALNSTSWGLGQIMGFNSKRAGFLGTRDMIAQFMAGEDAQIRGMGVFISNYPKMGPALRNKDWPRFARLYNGPAFKKNSYDTKLALAYHKARKELDAAPGPA